MDEPEIIINSLNVGPDCVKTICMALHVFGNELRDFGLLGEDEEGKRLTENYLARIEDIRQAMGRME